MNVHASNLKKMTQIAIELANKGSKYDVIAGELNDRGHKSKTGLPIDFRMVSKMLVDTGYKRAPRPGAVPRVGAVAKSVDRSHGNDVAIVSRLKAVKTILMLVDMPAEDRISHAHLLLENI